MEKLINDPKITMAHAEAFVDTRLGIGAEYGVHVHVYYRDDRETEIGVIREFLFWEGRTAGEVAAQINGMKLYGGLDVTVEEVFWIARHAQRLDEAVYWKPSQRRRRQ